MRGIESLHAGVLHRSRGLSPPPPHPRLDAVTDLVSNASLVGEVRKALRGLPDLERLLRKLSNQSAK